MKKIKNSFITIFLLMFIFILLFQNGVFAATDQFKAFLSSDFSTDSSSLASILLACRSFQTLGYTNAMGTDNYQKYATRSSVMNYINNSGNNYGLYISSHGNTDLISMKLNNSSEYIYPSQISGNWHLVFLDSCSSLATNSFANSFKANGYSNRATLGWYMTVTTYASSEFFKYFHVLVGTTNLRSACLSAADRCVKKTPIRMYGDTSWYGWAW